MISKTGPARRPAALSPAEIFQAWLTIGLQSFGGGLSTLTLIQRSFVQQRGWLTQEQFVRINAISQIAPGINILSIAIQIGDELGGGIGVAASLLGLLLPSVAITVAMTAAYAVVQKLPLVQAAFHGVIPATIGLGALTVWSMLRALLRESAVLGGKPETVIGASVVGLSALLIAQHAPVIAVLIAGGGIMAVARWAITRETRASPPFGAEAIEAMADASEAAEER